MTDKQEKILAVALELFAIDGYNATSTSKIAKQAGVSEGLIFRHFEHKKGLLDALIKDVEVRLMQVWGNILAEEDPKLLIRKTLELPLSIEDKDFNYWRLQFKLKWEQEYYAPEKVKPLLDRLTWAFKELKYEVPELEAKLLSQILESISIDILRQGVESQRSTIEFLLAKYNV